MSESEEGKKGKGSCIVWIVIGVIALVGFMKLGEYLKMQQEGGPLAGELKTPSSATKYFIKMAAGVRAGRMNPGVKGLMDVVTKSDKKWFYENQDKIYEVRRGDFDDLIGNTSSSSLADGLVAAHEIIGSCPDREDALILEERVDSSGKRATVIVEQGMAFGNKRNYTIELVKEGKVWKVSGFCGARERLERQIAAL